MKPATPSPFSPFGSVRGVAASCLVLLLAACLLPSPVAADGAAGDAENAETTSGALDAELLAGLSLRSIGPAVMGGRIADIAVHPDDPATWYVAVGSGGVWKTVNAGITWTPLFDDQPSYSIGCVTLDPDQPDTVWVGTGENVSGRHVGWGPGVSRSRDGGTTWEAMGLAASEHIGRILVDPRDSRVVYVAAEGPLWSAGGERGLYKSADGGASWERILHVDDDTGVTDVAFDPRNPDVLYAATYQRRRSVWSFLAGGPGSGIHKSTDAGATWRRISTGLPSDEVGKIGLAVSPADPDVVYATIEAQPDAAGFYRSTDRGESWEKRGSYLSNGTGPHYYQEIVASPHDVDRVYQMDVFLHTTADGGANFQILGTGGEKHSDNHALYVDPVDPDHLIAGTDGGLYETYDHGTTWRHTGNLPIAQLYKLAVDDAVPFYTVLGGAQDLGTLHGPVRTGNAEGIANRDWTVPLGADGHSCAFEPGDPNTFYAEWQVGRLHRFDRARDELIDIQPLPEPGEGPERWNWDAPLTVSPHAPARLYFASHRLWRSDDRGNSWRAVSGDLTRGENRYELPMAGRTRSIDALYDNGAMSWYATVSAIAESPRVEGLLYTGSDDGLLHVSEDGGGSWRRAATPAGLPERAFVNDLRASSHEDGTVFAALDNHKEGDYRPLVFESRDRGRTWRSLAGDLPESTIVWALAQDETVPDLLYAGAEDGLYVSLDRGGAWHRLRGGMPTISVRDLTIQEPMGDLVAATFGRGFYVLDDLGPLRELARRAGADGTAGAPGLLPVRDAWWFVPSIPMQAAGKPSQGSTDYTAANPPHGALLTVYLDDAPQGARDARREGEKALDEAGDDVPFPGWDRLRDEGLAATDRLEILIEDGEGRALRRLPVAARAGLQRLAWDLRLPAPDPVNLAPPGFRPPWAQDPRGPYVAPGRYTARLLRVSGETTETLGEPRTFAVRPVPGFERPAEQAEETAAFQRATSDLLREVNGLSRRLGVHRNRLAAIEAGLGAIPGETAALRAEMTGIRTELAALERRVAWDRILGQRNEPQPDTLSGRLGRIAWGHWETGQPPTETMRRHLEIAREEAAEAATTEQRIATAIDRLDEAARAAGAPWMGEG